MTLYVKMEKGLPKGVCIVNLRKSFLNIQMTDTEKEAKKRLPKDIAVNARKDGQFNSVVVGATEGDLAALSAAIIGSVKSKIKEYKVGK